MPQLNDLLYQLGRAQNWRVQLAALGLSGKLENQDNHPLTASKRDKTRENNLSIDTFVNKLNSFARK
jgi:hypothetical protein